MKVFSPTVKEKPSKKLKILSFSDFKPENHAATGVTAQGRDGDCRGEAAGHLQHQRLPGHRGRREDHSRPQRHGQAHRRPQGTDQCNVKNFEIWMTIVIKYLV